MFVLRWAMGVFQKWLFYMICHGICSNKSFYHVATPQRLCRGFTSPPVVVSGGMLGPRGLPSWGGQCHAETPPPGGSPGDKAQQGNGPTLLRRGRFMQSSRWCWRAPCPGRLSTQIVAGGRAQATLPLPVRLSGCCGGPDPSSMPMSHCPMSTALRLQTEVFASPPPETRSPRQREQVWLEQVSSMLGAHRATTTEDSLGPSTSQTGVTGSPASPGASPLPHRHCSPCSRSWLGPHPAAGGVGAGAPCCSLLALPPWGPGGPTRTQCLRTHP